MIDTVSTLRTNNQQAIKQEPRSDENLIQTVVTLAQLLAVHCDLDTYVTHCSGGEHTVFDNEALPPLYRLTCLSQAQTRVGLFDGSVE
jgi:hypothetical protein